jgi:hypothetical protein
MTIFNYLNFSIWSGMWDLRKEVNDNAREG